MRKIVVASLLLAALAVGVDSLARAKVQGRMANELAARLDLAEPPDVEIGGFPFLLDLIGGHFDRISIAAGTIRRRGIELSSVEVTLRDIEFTAFEALADPRSIRTGSGRGTARISGRELNALLARRGASIAVLQRGDRALVQADGTGRLMRAEISLHGRTLMITAEGPIGPVELDLPRVARGVTYESVAVRDGELLLGFTINQRFFAT